MQCQLQSQRHKLEVIQHLLHDKQSPAGSIPGVGKIPWKREWLSTLVSLPGESHGQRSLAGYSPQCQRESDMTEVT